MASSDLSVSSALTEAPTAPGDGCHDVDVEDFCVVGAGIVGLATAVELLRQRPGAGLVVLEKESSVGTHQTSHNSGVIHAGVYYAPGSLKADLCRAGARATEEFCAEHSIAFEVPGKLLVATNERELARLEGLRERAVANGLTVEALGGQALREREPHVAGLAALLVATTGIVDYGEVAREMARLVVDLGGRIETDVEVTGIREHLGAVVVDAGERRWTAGRLVVCGGLQADRLARLAGVGDDFQIVPFRGEYFRLPPWRNDIIRHLVYPVPDPDLPFLGVHLTRTADGGVTVGPNAVLGFAREGYRRLSFDYGDVAEYARFPGLWRVARTHARTGVRELRNSWWKRGYLAECRRYCPELTVADLLPHEAGIRAQAVLRDGTLVHDFLLRQTDRTLHVCNAPSPAATSAIPIASLIAARLLAPVGGNLP